jgi:hypothetical protein
MLHSAESISLVEYIFLLDNRQFSILFYCHVVGKTTYGPFCYNVEYKRGWYKSRSWVFRLRAVPKNLRAMMHKKKVLSATPRYATQCEIQAKHFLVDSALFENFSANSQPYANMFLTFIQ